ncbi:uncharacterized protein LOC141592856 isoform X2 [Silene latifolia]
MPSFQSTDRGIRAGVVRTSNSPDSRIVNRDRLIALFKRIQESISEEKSGIRRTSRRSKQPSDDFSVEATISELPHQSSSKQVNLQQSIPTTRKGRKPKEKSLPKPQQLSKNKLTRLPSNFAKKSPIPSPTPLRSNAHNVLDEAQLSSNKLTRPPSNFVKKSPIPSPTPLRNNVADDTELSSEDRADPEKLDEMKLSELKGVAKVRGIKGYSKLKKSELLELLRFQIKG